MQDSGQNFYNHEGINRDVNPFLVKPSDLYSSINFYSRIYGSKKVRFGYQKLLDTIDNQPIRNLIYYDLGDSLKGILRVSNKHIFKYDFTGATWGSAVKTFTVDTVIPWAVLMGTGLFLHLGNATDGYFTWDGTTFKKQSGVYTPNPSSMTAWNSRIFTDVNKLSLAESAISFDLNGYSLAEACHVTNGSKLVTGYGSLFISEFGKNFSVGIASSGPLFQHTILEITDDTHLTLSTPYDGSNASGLLMYYADGSMFAGTVAVTNGSTTVTGTGTTFLTAFPPSLSLLINNVVYRVDSILSDTKLNLSQVYAGTTTDLNIKTSYSADPFYLNSNDPAGGGTTSLTAGKDGQIINMSSSVDRVNIYKQFGVYKFNGQSFFRMPYRGNILGMCSTKDDIDYILATNGIFRNTGRAVEPADMGINTIIKDTIRVHGITSPVLYSLGDFTFFYIGTIRLGRGNNAQDITNGMLVHNEKYDSWDIWSLADQVTAFGKYVDPTTNEEVLISGDNVGNVYEWGEEYSTDNGVAIHYHLRTHYNNFGDPYKEKSPDRFAIALDDGDGATLQVAVDYKDDFGGKEQNNAVGFITKDYLSDQIRDFQAIAFQIMGSTKTNRPEFHGYSVGFKEMDDRPIDGDKQRRS